MSCLFLESESDSDDKGAYLSRDVVHIGTSVTSESQAFLSFFYD